MRQKVQTAQTQAKLDATAKYWNSQIADAETMRIQCTELKSQTRSQWENGYPYFILLSFDYAGQLDVPLVLDKTTDGY